MTLKQKKDFNCKVDRYLYDEGILTEGFISEQSEKIVQKVNQIIQKKPNNNDDTPTKFGPRDNPRKPKDNDQQ